MTPEDLAALHPRLFHMAEPEAWDSIRAFGLLSTEELLARVESDVSVREELVSTVRPHSIAYEDPAMGHVVIRDNKPMHPTRLAAAVVGIVPEDYLRLLNRRVFFWPTRERLERFLGVYGDTAQLILEVDTLSLARAHYDFVDISPINSGAVRMPHHYRGADTFAPLASVGFDAWRRSRGGQPRPVRAAIAEVCIRGSVPDLIDHLVRADLRAPGGRFAPVWE